MADHDSIPNLDGLVTLASRDGVDIKPTLLRVMTDLYVQKSRHSAEEERHYTELALRLIDAVDTHTRAAVTKKLSAYAAPPAAVMRRLNPTPDHAAGDQAAAAAVPLRAPAAERTPVVELCEIFFGATAEERKLILLNLEYSQIAPADPIPALTSGPAIQRLELAALAHNGAGFAQELERALGISNELARRLFEDGSGEPIVIACRALAMPEDILQRVLLCLNPVISQSVLRVYELARLHEELSPGAALRMLAIWRASHKRSSHPRASAQPIARRDPSLQPPVQRSTRWTIEERPSLPARPQISWEEHAMTRKAENE